MDDFMSFDSWLTSMNLLLEIGKEKGYLIYNEQKFNTDDGDYEVAKRIARSDMFENTAWIGWKGI